MNPENWRDYSHDLELDVMDLRDRIKKLRMENFKLKCRLDIARDNEQYIKDKLLHKNAVCVPHCVSENNEFECGTCGNELRQDYDHFCPGCGNLIDWDEIEWQDYHDEPDPGEQFLRDEVYEPLREQLARERDD